MQLYTWQAEYLKDLPKDVVMTATLGSGKTVLSLKHAERYSPNIPIIVVAPASKIRTKDWEREAKDWQAPLHSTYSYEMFAKQQELPPEYVLIVDECTYIKSATAKRSKSIIRAVQSQNCKQFILLSGTPLPKGWQDMQTYGILFGLWKNKTQFFNQHVLIDRSRGYPRIIGYANEDKLKHYWSTISKGLDHILDLPPRRTINVNIKLTESQLAGYKHIKQTRVTENGDLLDMPSKLHTYLRQSLATHRMDALRNILDDTSDHAIIFYNYNLERDAILKVLESYPERHIWEQSGHRSNLPDRANWDNMPPSVTIAQYMSASHGIELTYAHITVYYSPTYSYADFAQSIGRTFRTGQKYTTLYYFFKCLKTIDLNVYRCIANRQDFQDNLWEEENAY
jgi:superfamily II DNA or RNA helicase